MSVIKHVWKDLYTNRGHTSKGVHFMDVNSSSIIANIVTKSIKHFSQSFEREILTFWDELHRVI